MRIIADTSSLDPALQHAVAALGNFDGLHRGHQAVLSEARRLAREMEKLFAVMTFEPHPRALFFPEHAPFRITPPAIKRRLLAEMGADILYEIPFTRDFSQMNAASFVDDLLVRDIRLAHAVIGHDFVFGFRRGGDADFLQQKLALHGVGTNHVAPQADGQAQLWSSTRVRAHLEKGEMRAVAGILGRAWTIEGAVRKGDARGRDLGFPTANLDLDGYIRPRYGVYAVRVKTVGSAFDGVANVGRRPTVAGADERLEAHLFDFSGDLYGQAIAVNFVDFIRDEARFASLDALKAQISNDCLAARAILA